MIATTANAEWRFRYLDSFWQNERFWQALIALGCALRVWQILVLQHPLDAIFSDPGRHWDNAQDFLNPGPMGSGNPVFYQLFLALIQQLTSENRLALGLVTVALSLSLPLTWYLFAREVLTAKLSVLRVTAVITLLPTLSFMYMYFMTETVLLPLLGSALWLTWRSVRLSSRGGAFVAAIFWLACTLTRPVVLPVALLCLLWCVLRQRRRALLAVACLSVWALGMGLAARRSYEHYYRYSPFGHDVNLHYFLSGAKTWEIHFKHGYYYIFESPSFSIPPFYPFSDWQSSRSGKVTIFLDRERRGEDLEAQLVAHFKVNRDRLPLLLRDNLVFYLFSHSWPEAGLDRLDGLICLWERWLWFPLLVFAFVNSTYLLLKVPRGERIFPLVVIVLITATALPLAVMEGRYRKPAAPLAVVAIAWIVERHGRRREEH